jgi:hypothetical protein
MQSPREDARLSEHLEEETHGECSFHPLVVAKKATINPGKELQPETSDDGRASADGAHSSNSMILRWIRTHYHTRYSCMHYHGSNGTMVCTVHRVYSCRYKALLLGEAFSEVFSFDS